MPDRVSVSQVQAAIEAAGAVWQAGVTSVSELPPEEQQIRLGVLPPPGGFDALMRRAEAFASVAAVTAAGLPSAFDLRNINGRTSSPPYATRAGAVLASPLEPAQRSKANSAFNATTRTLRSISPKHTSSSATAELKASPAPPDGCQAQPLPVPPILASPM